ncbi:MAG TPA: hypothetical protein VG347_00765 [Verrucomicrobiae bacterium]|nr:hypothetical protein [Verrucomicrobiae bacterium]
MSPDTNQVAQALQAADMVRDHVQTNWPAICAGALWLRTEVKNVSEYVIGHGGLGMIVKKLFWNPAPTI